jgi:hypothetical protein
VVRRDDEKYKRPSKDNKASPRGIVVCAMPPRPRTGQPAAKLARIVIPGDSSSQNRLVVWLPSRLCVSATCHCSLGLVSCMSFQSIGREAPRHLRNQGLCGGFKGRRAQPVSREGFLAALRTHLNTNERHGVMTSGPFNVVMVTKQVHQLLSEYGMVWCRVHLILNHILARVVEVMSAGRSVRRHHTSQKASRAREQVRQAPAPRNATSSCKQEVCHRLR